MHSSYRSSFAKKRLPLKEITSHGGAIIFLPTARLLYIYRTSSLTDRERSRTKKKENQAKAKTTCHLKRLQSRDRETENSVRRDASGSPSSFIRRGKVDDGHSRRLLLCFGIS